MNITIEATFKDPEEVQEKFKDSLGIMELDLQAIKYIEDKNFIPFNMKIYASLTRSTLAMDFFMLIHQRAFKVYKQGRPANIPWTDLFGQFGTGISDHHDFIKNSRAAIKKVFKVYDGSPVTIDIRDSVFLRLKPAKKTRLVEI